MKSVAVVGRGVVSPHGSGMKRLWDGVFAGVSATTTASLDSLGPAIPVALVPDDGWLSSFTTPERRRLDRSTLLSLAAMQEAIQDAESHWTDAPPERRAIVVGIGLGGLATITGQAEALRGGWRKISPFGLPAAMPSAAAGFGSARFDARGIVSTVCAACASGTQAIAEGHRLISDDLADVVLAGGVESLIDPLAAAGFARMEAMSKNADRSCSASRPFDLNRDGFVLGEGAGFLVLARYDESSVASIATIDGWALSSDAHDIAAPIPSGRGAVSVMRRCISAAGLLPDQIGHVNAHGTSTKLNDQTEARALAEVFSNRGVPVTSNKGTIGHLLGAAGAVETLVTIESLRQGIVPPTANCDHNEFWDQIDVVTGEPRKTSGRHAMKTSFGFGGQNAAIVVSVR